jgi:hypothetical protein
MASNNQSKNMNARKVLSPPPSSDLDIHCWVECSDGSIYDPYFKEYDMVKRVHGVGKTTKVCYGAITDKAEKKRLWTVIWKRGIRPIVRDNPGRDVFAHFLSHPQFGHCFLNAYAYHLANKGTVFQIGKMGWEKKNGVWWEYG